MEKKFTDDFFADFGENAIYGAFANHEGNLTTCPPDFLKRLKPTDSSLRVMAGSAIRLGV